MRPTRPPTVGRFVAGLVGLFVCSTMAWLLLWAMAASAFHGSAPVLVASGSMGPSVRAGDLVVLEPFHSQELRPGSVIQFEDPAGRGPLLHRVVEVERDGTVHTKGDANAVVDASAVDPGRITGVGHVLIPRAGLPVLWWRNGELLALGLFLLVTLTSLGVTRFALLDRHDPWVGPERPRPPRVALRVRVPAACRGALAAVRAQGPWVLGRRVLAGRGAELAAVVIATAFLLSSTTAWAAFRDTTADGPNQFGAGSLAPPTNLQVAATGCGTSSAIAAHGTAGGANLLSGADVTVATPGGTQAGDVLVSVVTFHTRDFAGTITAGAGWTAIRVDNDTKDVLQGVFWRVATASEPASHTFVNTTGDTGREAVAGIAAYGGVDTASPIAAHAATTYPSNTTSLVAPSVTPGVGGSRLITAVGQRGGGPLTPPVSMTERFEQTALNQVVGEAADEALSGGGASGTRTTSSGANRTGVAQTVALRPATVTFRAATTATAPNNAAGQLTLNRPFAAQPGDVLIAQVTFHTHSFTGGIGRPSGWNTVRVDQDGEHVIEGVFWRLAGASEPASYTFTNQSGDTTQQAAGVLAAYDNVDPAVPVVDSASTLSVTAGSTITTPSVTGVTGGRLVTAIGVYGNDQGPVTPPGSMTERGEVTEVSESAVVEVLSELADQPTTSNGATGTRDFGVPNSFTWVATAITLRPPTGLPYADLTWTPTVSTFADGYVVERRIGTTLDDSQSVTPAAVSGVTDGPLTSGTTYTYRVITTAGTWRSVPATRTFTAPAC